MALSVRDLMKLQCFTHLSLVAGEKGLDNKVCGMGILDYELMPEYIDEFLSTFTPGDFVLCSFLYQYCCDKPQEILPMVKALADYGAAGIGWKDILFHELPEEVLEFANENNFPIFRFGKDIYYENITFEISDALQTDDRNLLTSENITDMILGIMPKNQIYTIAKNLSISFKEMCRVVFLSRDSDEFQTDIIRYCKSFYLSRTLGDKAMITPYKNGMFLILTASKSEESTFDIILKEILEYLNISEPFYSCASRIQKPFENLDKCFKESYNTYLASLAEGKNFDSYDKLGVYEILVGDFKSAEMGDYMERYLSPIIDKPDYLEAAEAVVKSGGDIAKAANLFGCHQNTIRYKLSRMREFTNSPDESENDFYMNLSLALRIYRLRQVEK